MEAKDYAELALLVRGAEKALLSGTLNDWQHANTSTFHVLATAIGDLNERISALSNAYDRLARLESSVCDAPQLASVESTTDKPVELILNGN